MFIEGVNGRKEEYLNNQIIFISISKQPHEFNIIFHILQMKKWGPERFCDFLKLTLSVSEGRLEPSPAIFHVTKEKSLPYFQRIPI